RFVVRRSAMARGRDRTVDQFEPVPGVSRRRLVRKTGSVQCGVEPITAAITGEHAPGAVGAVRGRGEPNDQQPRSGVAEIGNGPAPISFVTKGLALLARYLRGVGRQPRT